MIQRIIGALAAFCLLLPIAAQAQDLPSYANQPYPADQNIHGRVLNFDGGYNLAVRDERGYVDNVQLHPGTIINPTGLTLAPGMIVSILGYNAGSYFSANEIDTPYRFYSGYPYYAGHPWNYYGPSISLGFFFGNPGWWHGRSFYGGYHYVGGARVYNNVHVNEIYRRPGGDFHGRDFVAPAAHGGYYGHPAPQGHATHAEGHAHTAGHAHAEGHAEHGGGDHH
ncbi:MAG: hypothetical protein ABSB70_06765 [Candidatus Velthaea sp.]|jgi:hypothetical protein